MANHYLISYEFRDDLSLEMTGREGDFDFLSRQDAFDYANALLAGNYTGRGAITKVFVKHNGAVLYEASRS